MTINVHNTLWVITNREKRKDKEIHVPLCATQSDKKLVILVGINKGKGIDETYQRTIIKNNLHPG